MGSIERNRRYEATHKEQRRLQRQKYNATPERKAAQKAWAEANPDKLKEYAERRNARAKAKRLAAKATPSVQPETLRRERHRQTMLNRLFENNSEFEEE